MKTLLIAFLLASGLLAEPLEHVTVNSKLPEDQIIHLVGEPDGKATVTAGFVSEREIFSVAQGNWRRSVKLITYKVAGDAEGFPGGSLTFICEDSFPVEGSRIKVKRMPWPFKPGEMDFWLKRDERCLLSPFFNIVSYRAAL